MIYTGMTDEKYDALDDELTRAVPAPPPCLKPGFSFAKITTIGVVILLILANCGKNGDPSSPDIPGIDMKNARHVVLIGLDGWGGYSLPRADMPIVKEMMNNGSYTLKARSVLPSISSPNWASMFTGTNPEIHGFTSNTEKPDLQPPVTDPYGFTPSIFSLLHEQKPASKIDFFYEWSGISFLFPPDVMDYAALCQDLSNNEDQLKAIESQIKKEKPELTVIIFDEPDHTGHSAGHDTPEYYECLKKMDTSIGRIKQAVIDAGIYDDTVFILSADHGGVGTGHGGNTAEEREIPLILFGKNIKQDYQIDASVMIYDIAPTMAHIFNLEQPAVWIGRALSEVFINSEK